MFERFDSGFEPSSQTKEAMLYTRKRALLLGGMRHPGLLGLHRYTVDWVFFLLVLLLEAIGLYAFYNALEQSDTSLWTAFAATGGMLVLDFVLAFCHHRSAEGIVSKLEVENILTSKLGGDHANIDIEKNNDIIRRRKRMAFALSIVLILLAVAKFGIFYMLNLGSGDIEYGVVAFMAIAYLIAAAIHINVTGFLIHALWAKWLYARDISTFKASNGQVCSARDYPIELSYFPEFQKGFSVRTHAVASETNAGSGQLRLILKANGLLMDHDIEEMSYKIHDAHARTEFILKAMELQIRMI